MGNQNNAFVETGVLIGYCLLLDKHHHNCSSYIDGNSRDYYTSKEVKAEYNNTKTTVKSRLSSAVLDHVRDLKGDSHQGYLDQMDVREIRNNVLDKNNEAYRFLYNYYSNEVNMGVDKSKLEKKLRNIARDIDRSLMKRESQLMPKMAEWKQKGTHPSVETALSMIHNPDRKFAVQAHDLADNNGGNTEFVTANPQDFVYNGRKKKVLNNTALDDVVDLSA